MGNECCVSRAGSKCVVNSMVLSRIGGRDEGGGKSRIGRRGLQDVGAEPGLWRSPWYQISVRAIEVLPGSQASAQ